MPADNSITWFITGASSGFGMAIARYAVGRGYNVVATARSVAKLAALTALAPDRVLAEKLDVTIPADATKAVKAAIARFGRIDVLINNAGYGIIGAVEETPEAEFRAQMDTNFFGTLSVTKAALPYLRAQKGGAIVNVSSMGGQLSFPGVRCLFSFEIRAGGHVGGLGSGGRTVRHQGDDCRARRIAHQFLFGRHHQADAGDAGLQGRRRHHACSHA